MLRKSRRDTAGKTASGSIVVSSFCGMRSALPSSVKHVASVSSQPHPPAVASETPTISSACNDLASVLVTSLFCYIGIMCFQVVFSNFDLNLAAGI